MKKKIILIVAAVLLLCALTVTISVFASENKAPAATEEPVSDQPAENADSTEKIVVEEQTFAIPAPELLSKVTEVGTEVVNAELLQQVRTLLKDEKPILTPELAREITSAMEKLYDTNDTFIMPAFYELVPGFFADKQDRVMTKPVFADDENKASHDYFARIMQINEMILYTYRALTPAEYLIPGVEVFEDMAYLGRGYPHFIPLTGDFETPEEAIELIRTGSDKITYIVLDYGSAELRCGDTCISLTLS